MSFIPLFLSDRKLEGVHGLRGCAALGIVLFHQRAIPGLELPSPASDFIDHLYLSVLFFFALSAFTLAHSHTIAPTSYKAYLAKRFFRIAPLFYAVIFWNLTRIPAPGLDVLLTNFAFIFNLVPGLEQSLAWAGWSVGVEMIAYLLLPFFFAAWRPVWAAAVGYCACVLISAALWWLFDRSPTLPPNYAYFFVGTNLSAFAAGILAYRLYGTSRHAEMPRRPWWPGVGAVSLGMMIALYLDVLGLHYRSPGFYFSLWALAFALACSKQAEEPIRVLRTRAMQWLGDRSFSVYLLHPIVIELGKPIYASVGDLGVGQVATYLGSLAITLSILFILAETTYRLVELPGMRIGSRLSSRLDTQQPIRAAARGAA